MIDVRSPGEVSSISIGKIMGKKNKRKTLHIPLNDIYKIKSEEDLKKLAPKDGKIFCLCRSGYRSSLAQNHLIGLGANAINVSGGIMGFHSYHRSSVRE